MRTASQSESCPDSPCAARREPFAVRVAPELEAVGVLAEPHSAAGMAEAIASLYTRDVSALGAAARARVLRHFTWGRAFQAQVGAYASLLAAQRVPVADTPILELRSGSP